MKNFTNNFKQFTSRLSARWLIMALMLLLGTSSAWAANKYTYDYIFLDLSGFISWASADATFKVGLNTWDNTGGGTMSTFSMTKVPGETYIYYANVSSALTSDRYGIKFSRCSPSGSEWNSFFSSYSSGNCGKPSDWNSGSITTKTDVYCISAPTFGEVEVGQSATSSGTYLYAGVSTIPEISNNSTEFQYVAGSSSITTNGSFTITVKFTPSSAGDKTGTLKFGSYLTTSLSGTGKVSCTPSATLSSAVYDAVNNEIDLSGSIETCDNNLFYGFLWKNKEDANWNTANAISGTGGSNNNTTEDIDFNQSWDDFTPGDTYEFTAYALDATTNPYTWYYSTDENNVIEVSTCTSIPDNTYVIAGNNEWTGNANPVTINYDANTYGTPTISYNGEAQIPTDVGTYAITINVPAHNGYCASTISLGDYEITCIDVEKPAITTSATVCAGTQVTLSNYNGVNTNTVKWYSSQEFNSEVTEQVTLPDDGTVYYAKAYHEASGCYSSEYSTLTFTVNPKPTITITGNNSAVLYEDVTLTATGENIDNVVWTTDADKGTITKDATDPKEAILTYDQTGAVIVTATATSAAGCTSVAATKTVTFGEENCNDVVVYDNENVEIWLSSSLNTTMYLHRWYENGDQDTGIATWPGAKTTKSDGYYKWTTTSSGNIGYIFHDNTANNKSSDANKTLEKGYRYYFTFNGGTGGATFNKSERITTTTPAQITAPAVKMVSAKYNETTDKIDVVAAVYKRGCDNVEWGFQYSEDGITWSDKIHPNSHTATAVGEVAHSFSIDGGDGNTYYIRAYAKNSNSEVTSANTKSVEIPSSIIESATISLVDSEGEESDVTEVCPQSIVYLKVSYVGGDFKDYEAADNFPGTNLELVNHDKANNYAIFSYTATATGVPNITISNDNTSITTTNDVSITLKDVAPVNAPMISISQATICDDRSATITVKEPIAGLTYTLYKETTKIAGPVIYDDDDDLTFNVTEAGTYTVRAEESVCKNYANSMAVELKVVTSDVKIGLAVDKTTVNPWQPLKLTVTAPEGYAYTIDALNDVVYTQAGNVYTIKIPRPNDWSPGNSGDSVKTKDITFEAKIQVTVDLTCGSSSIKVKLEDTDENCK
ncbi:MAG: hypothetical protein U0L34_06440 [Paludibacteraceae bacterium]|nr:hypothetical protein [Paludibacteraceae bacterium]